MEVSVLRLYRERQGPFARSIRRSFIWYVVEHGSAAYSRTMFQDSVEAVRTQEDSMHEYIVRDLLWQLFAFVMCEG